MVGVDFGVHVAHVGFGDFAGEVGEGCAEGRKSGEGFAADDGDSIVRGEIVEIGRASCRERV